MGESGCEGLVGSRFKRIRMTDVPIFFEGAVQLAGWVENHSQGCRVTFWLASPEDLEPFRMATVRKAKMAGQLFQMVLVEIDPDDGDKPIRHLSSDAHLLVTGIDFLNYARSKATKPGSRDDWDGPRAKAWAKYVAQIESLAEIDTDPAARLRFERLIRIPFAEWNGTRGAGHGDVDTDGEDVDGRPGEPA
jgi:hypothetical protein